MTMFSIKALVFASAVLALTDGQSKELENNTIHESEENVDDPYVCTTIECNKIASKFRSSMNKSVRPCENFYKFACGNYKKNDSETVDYKMAAKLKDIIEHYTGSDSASRQVRIFYKSCMNTEDVSEEGKNYIKQQLEDKGGWPLLKGDDWKEEDHADDNFEYLNYIVTIYFDSTDGTTNRRIIKITKYSSEDEDEDEDDEEADVLPSFDSSLNYYLKLIEACEKLGASRLEVQEEVQKIVTFEADLYKIGEMSENYKGESECRTTIRSLEANYPYFPWENVINYNLPENLRINKQEEVILEDVWYFQRLEPLLSKASLRDRANYAMGRNVSKHFKFIEKLPSDRSDSQWNECISLIIRQFPVATSSMYVRSNTKSSSEKESGERMTKAIKDQMINLFNQAEWMDTKTKTKAVEKVKAMTEHIGYYSKLLSTEKVDEYHDGLDFADGRFIKNYFESKAFRENKKKEKLRLVVDKNDWFDDQVMEDNAYHYPSKNAINVPAPNMEGFDKKPQYVNHGLLGFTIGHEISHGFDSDGYKYNKFGEYFNWWTPKPLTNYKKKVECIVNQYNDYIPDGVDVKVDGKKTSAENIADTIGTKVAYLAYLDWLEQNEEEQSLPGFQNYTARQMFWISMASYFCSNSTPEDTKDTIQHDDHSPNEIRVIGPLSNIEEFSEDFHCLENSLMNPKKKCTFWED